MKEVKSDHGSNRKRLFRKGNKILLEKRRSNYHEKPYAIFNKQYTEQTEVLGRCRLYCESLLSAELINNKVIEEFLSAATSLTPESSNLCYCEITKDEILKTLQNMAKNECPGSDGLP